MLVSSIDSSDDSSSMVIDQPSSPNTDPSDPTSDARQQPSGRSDPPTKPPSYEDLTEPTNLPSYEFTSPAPPSYFETTGIAFTYEKEDEDQTGDGNLDHNENADPENRELEFVHLVPSFVAMVNVEHSGDQTLLNQSQ